MTPTPPRTRITRLITLGVLIVSGAVTAGCAITSFIGGAAQNIEYQKKIEVAPKYNGLAGKRVAILVDVPMGMLYQHSYLPSQIATGVAISIQNGVEGVSVIDPQSTLTWQYRTNNWNLWAYGDIIKALNVDRVVVVDIYEYRLNPPGNRYEWDGACAAHVRIIENAEDALDPDVPADEYNIIAKFPDQQGIVLTGATAQNVEAGVLTKFIQKTGWLFYTHEEPKYPDKYRPELDNV